MQALLEAVLTAADAPKWLTLAGVGFLLLVFQWQSRRAQGRDEARSDREKRELAEDDLDFKQRQLLGERNDRLIDDLRADLARVREERDHCQQLCDIANSGREAERVRAHDLANEVSRCWAILKKLQTDPFDGMDEDTVTELKRKLRPRFPKLETEK